MAIDPFPEQRPLRELYVLLMEELKRRRNLVGDLVQQKYPLPMGIAAELCYLQLRMICELIALACLAAHGDIPATQSGKIQKAYAPGAILPELEKLHPEFYPMPGVQRRFPDGKIKLEKVTTPYLTKDELLKLWAECGNKLHRGSMKNIDRQISVDFKPIIGWDSKITTLLSHHQIQLRDPKYQMWVIMQTTDDGGRAHAWLFEKISGPPAMDGK